jgi:DNA-binding CsgD family transcriptional regulator
MLEALVSRVRECGVTVLVRGQVGVGKSRLLAAVCDCAERRGIQVCRVSGVRAEMGVSFAGLHQLLRPLLEQAQDVSRAVREALFGSFGMDCATRADTFAIAVATLELMAKIARQTPLILIVDDAHLLDSETAQVLGFVARRLGPEPIALLMAVREGCDTELLDFHVPELRVGPLDETSAATLLDLRAPGLSSKLRAQVLAEGAGNPLALVELAVAPRSERVAFDRPGRLWMTERLTRAFAERFLFLPERTRAALLIASLDEEITLGEIASATSLIDHDVSPSIDDLGPAVDSRLVERDNTRLSFWHPLVSAAIYQTEPAGRRRRAHAALASVLSDSGRRAWHRAASIELPDEAVADELEAAALRAKAWRKPSMRAAALERAAELTPESGARQHRFLRVAEMALAMGHTDRVDGLLGEIDAEAFRPPDHARIRVIHDLVEAGYIRDAGAVDSLVDAAVQASLEEETDLALKLLQAAACRAWWAGLGPEVRAGIAAATRRVGAPETEPRVLCVLAMTEPEGIAETLYRVGSRTPPTGCDAETAYVLGTALHVAGVFDRSAIFLDVALAGLRRRGIVWLLPQALAQQAWNAVYAGKWNLASATAEEATEISRDLRQPVWEATAQAVLSVMSAIQGDEMRAEKALAHAESVAVPLGASAVLADTQLARAIIALGAGRYEEAFEHLQRTFDPYDPAHHYVRSAWRIAELAEVATHAGRIHEAREQLAHCERKTHPDQSSLLKVGVLYARPVLADDSQAETLFQAALSADLTSWPIYRARLLLQYGMWLRRHRKVAKARMPLRAARDLLTALGADAWVERARQELRASRETQHNESGGWMQLTEQELQIAQLAAQGLTNQVIGQHLYISHRTVGSHLYRIFPKLGISSRVQLSAALQGR